MRNGCNHCGAFVRQRQQFHCHRSTVLQGQRQEIIGQLRIGAIGTRIQQPQKRREGYVSERAG